MSLSHCSEVVIGGGWSGVYFAYRRLDEPAYNASRLCLFEASDRIGGRTYSVRDELDLGDGQLTLDVGAYRFSPDMHLPGDLILKRLQLPTLCYEPGCPSPKLDMPKPFLFNYSAPLRRVVDPSTGLPAGYDTPIRAMVRSLKAAGATVALEHELVGISPSSGGAPPTLAIRTPSGSVLLSPTLALLNVPRARLLPLPGVSDLFGPRATRTLRCVKFDQPPGPDWKNWSIPETSFSALSKAYFGYDDAWWQTKLNQTSGEYPENAFFPLKTSFGIDIGVRWSDGPVVCQGGGGCAGYLEAYYAVSNETFFASVSGQPFDPLGTIRSSDPNGPSTLATVHAALMEAIAPILRANAVSPSSIPPPRQLVVGVWARPDKDASPIGPPLGYTAPTKVYYVPEVSGSLGEACGVDGLTEAEYRSTALQPLGKGVRLFMANNDWVALNTRYMFGDWAEETLLQAERALLTLGSPRPSWLDPAYYKEKIASVLAQDTADTLPEAHGAAAVQEVQVS